MLYVLYTRKRQLDKFPLGHIPGVTPSRVDEKGNLLECDVQVVKPDVNPQLATEIAEALKTYHPWKVYYINGEYRALGIENWSIPYILHDK